jgi:hypothetical protein
MSGREYARDISTGTIVLINLGLNVIFCNMHPLDGGRASAAPYSYQVALWQKCWIFTQS